MKRLVLFAVLALLISSTGCSFLMKEYDDRNEKKLAEVSEENKSLVMKVRNLERKVPDMSEQMSQLQAENKQLKNDISTLNKKLSGTEKISVEDIKTMAEEASGPKPAPAPETATSPAHDEDGEPFRITPAEPTVPKPEPQAKAKLTDAGAKLLEMAQKQSGNADETEMITAIEVASAKAAPKPAPDTALNDSADEPEAAPAPEEKPESVPVAKAAEPAKPQTNTDEKKSVLTPEGARLLAMAKGEPEPKEPVKTEAAPVKTEAAPVKNDTTATRSQTAAKLKQIAQAKSTPSTGSQKTVSSQSVKLKVLSGTGNITDAQTMAKKLQSMGFNPDGTSLAPRSNFKENVVYYAKGFDQTAQDLKAKIGGKTTTKPLSWNSTFDIIVVATEQ